MAPSDVLQATLLDIVFEARNKAYGAYALRKQYNRRLGAALAAALSTVFALLYVTVQSYKKDATALIPQVPIEELVVHTNAIPPEAPKTPPAPVKPNTNRPAAQRQYTQFRITKNEAAVTAMPSQTDLKNLAISNAAVAGVPADAVPAIAEPAATASSYEPPLSEAPISSAPQFPGGAAAWQAFLSRNLEAPETLEPGEKKTVLVHFMVAEDGAVTALSIVQSGGKAFDTEVIRVLKKMPKWKPALKNGVPVSVSFTQPVTFIAMGY